MTCLPDVNNKDSTLLLSLNSAQASAPWCVQRDLSTGLFELFPASKFTLTCGLSLAAAVDLIVAIALIYYRLKTPRRACEEVCPSWYSSRF